MLEAYAIPSGVINQESFDTLLNRYLERLKNLLPVDGLLLDLHGAMVTEKHEDGEGTFPESRLVFTEATVSNSLLPREAEAVEAEEPVLGKLSLSCGRLRDPMENREERSFEK